MRAARSSRAEARSFTGVRGMPERTGELHPVGAGCVREPKTPASFAAASAPLAPVSRPSPACSGIPASSQRAAQNFGSMAPSATLSPSAQA